MHQLIYLEKGDEDMYSDDQRYANPFLLNTQNKKISKTHQLIYLEKCDEDRFSIGQPYASPFY